MTHWETIQDRSAHLSQVKLVPPKNYSVERGNGIFDGKHVTLENNREIVVTNQLKYV